jgi:HlyD family secretion protein
VTVARERYYTALDQLYALQTGDDSLQVKLAATTVQQAEATVAQAEAARAQVEAELALIDLQLDKLLVKTPVAGVVLTRSLEPGEVIAAGAALITVGQLDALTITVYLPEDQYGSLQLGNTAEVVVDSFPDETFAAAVIRIADEAEFTPRNVQTAEGRRTTVFAVELSVDNPAGKLKPGMPADVTFTE